MRPDERSSPPPPAPRAVAETAVRVAVLALPVLSVLVAALVLLGPGARRPVLGARIRGLPADGTRSLALRVEVVKSLYDIVDAVPSRAIMVEASAPGQALVAWRGETGSDGIADAVLEASEPLHGPVAIRIATHEDARQARLLAGGELTLRRPAVAFVQLGTIPGVVHGELAIRVDALRGVLAAPFAEELRVTVSSHAAGRPLGRCAELELSGAGMELAPERVTTDERGMGSVRVKPLGHNVELMIVARAGDKSARWVGTLPVVPGAMWLEPSAGEVLSLVAPSPREHAYVSLWSDEGRVFGAVVPLARDSFGFFRGQVLRPRLPSARLLYATVAGDPLEQGSGTTAWPLRPPEGAVAVAGKLEMLLDGVPAAVEREQQRAWTARRAGLVMIGAGAVVEMLLLLMQSRASQQKLLAHLQQAASEGLAPTDRGRLINAAREHVVLRTLLLVALVGLSFALVAVLSAFR